MFSLPLSLSHVVAIVWLKPAFLVMASLQLQVSAANFPKGEVGTAGADGVGKAKAKACQKKPGKSVGDGEEQYAMEHLSAFTEVGLQWPPAFDSDPAFVAKVSGLPRRQQELVWFAEHTEGQAEVLKHWRAQDINMTIDWGRSRQAVVPCIASKSSVWIRGRVEQHNRYGGRARYGSQSVVSCRL